MLFTTMALPLHEISKKAAEIVVERIHVLPNILSPIIIKTTQGLAAALLSTATLSFLGLGVQPPIPEWGALIASGREFILSYPHLVTIPGIFIAITVFSFNLMGDALRDAFDPRLKN